jgi:hypothetical protein
MEQHQRNTGKGKGSMKKHGVFYSTRKLPGDKHGILVKTYIRGEWITTDQNTMPWPTYELALKQASRMAVAEAEKEGGLPVYRGDF